MVPLLLSVLLSFVPAFCYAWVVYWIDHYEREPRWLLVCVFLWGAIVAVIGALFFSIVLQESVRLITNDDAVADLTGTVLIAPLVEESVKGLAVLIVFFAFRREFDSTLDGIVYAGVVALGFAATENVLYLYNNGYGEGGMSGLLTLFVVRVLLGGWNHAVYTAFTGIGLAIARQSRIPPIKLAAPVLGWTCAVLAHALHNTLATVLGERAGLAGLGATLLSDWLGWLFITAIIVWALRRERGWMVNYLRDEVERGTLTAAHYATACSLLAQTSARLSALGRGRYGATWRFYQLCGELAQKKHQLLTDGDEGGNAALVEQLRGELAQLAPQVA